MASQDPVAEKCPVDHKTRETWLAQAKKANPSATQPPSSPHAAAPSTLATPGCDSSSMEATQTTSPHTPPPSDPSSTLGTTRVISTIPRALPTSPSQTTAPANSERDTGADKATGNWIYPSERMFFDAMRRKSHSASPTDMSTIVPIHNAVNERAWAEILRWETPFSEASKCSGPRLESFSGTASAMTPRARWNTHVLGYKPPFDRHDWVVDRCGTRVEYVIDFYAGRDEGVEGKALNFYLDVRPKLNSWEGVKMRALKFMGW
ncbi:cytochrome c and c1 heme-lyase [Bimuria novae-zelandiae CBS 107.79]|uniref:Holocytochrome c-type synthase n=1 Tax=Bimuria novae-zelandiae CBS 107.79 TaxID=1447943 RepID=A0A6A5UI88_9PLEO|nr:cytochrome c and c1 heme-lyase [Bimuria novae-zelandiae CBS 107.79]